MFRRRNDGLRRLPIHRHPVRLAVRDGRKRLVADQRRWWLQTVVARIASNFHRPDHGLRARGIRVAAVCRRGGRLACRVSDDRPAGPKRRQHVATVGQVADASRERCRAALSCISPDLFSVLLTDTTRLTRHSCIIILCIFYIDYFFLLLTLVYVILILLFSVISIFNFSFTASYLTRSKMSNVTYNNFVTILKL